MKKPNHGISVKKRRKWYSSRQKPRLSTTTSSKHNNNPNPNPNPNPDLISALPDSLLLHILSLLDMEQVMKTSLLSKRWRYLWKSIPCLCFGSPRDFPGAEFTNFIDKCLFHCEGNKIHKLHIIFNYNEDTDAPLVDSWLHFAIKCKVEDIKLDFFGGDDYKYGIQYDKIYKLPRSLYLCTTLSSLNLRGCNLNLPDSFQLGSLKKLSLELLELNPDLIEHLSSSCPLLDEIYIIDCNRGRDLNIVITNGHVKRLEISNYGKWDDSDSVKINAPTLLSLGIYNFFPSVRFHVEELGSLMSVDLIGGQSFISYYEYVCLDESDNDINCFGKLLYDLRHVKHLKLCGRCLQVLSLTKLKRLYILSISATYLELKAGLEKWELPGISFLLENCPNLEKLKIVNEKCSEEITLTEELIDKHDFEEEEFWASFETDVTSIMQSIRSIEIDLGGESHYEEFVRFLLKNAKVLERMVINTPKGYAKYNFELFFKLSQRLHAFPRSSSNAKLFIT